MRRNAALSVLLTIFIAVGASGASSGFSVPLPLSDSSPLWSADGTSIAFLRHSALNVWTVHSVPASGGDVTLLATLPEGRAAYPRLSPDWKKVAFRFDRGLRVMEVDGSGVADIPIDTYDVAWSPDSSSLAISTNDELFVVRADGSGLRKVADGTYPAWSPDGARLAFVSFPDVTVVDRNGANLHRVWRASEWSGPPAWSHDGQRLAFPTDGRLHVIDADSTVVMSFAGSYVTNLGPSWSFDDNRLASANGSRVSVFDLRSRRERHLPLAYTLEWAPTSNVIAFESYDPCSWAGIHVASAISGSIRRLTLGCRINGDARDNVLQGTVWRDVIAGLRGNDRILGGPASDLLYGGPGDDVISGGPYFDDRGDVIDGGPGDDILHGGRAEGSDHGKDDLLLGRSGADVLSGGPGRDVLNGGSGPDTIHARDGERDVISCGRGRDVALVDKFDRAQDCESVRLGRP